MSDHKSQSNDHAELSIDHLRTMLDAYRSVVTVSYDDECGEWTAEVVGLPGCIGAGDTAEEAVRTALWFAPGWIETMFERNRSRIAELEAWQKMVCELPTIEMAEARAVVSRALAALARLGGNDSTEHRLAKSASQHIDMALATQTRRLMSRIAELEREITDLRLELDASEWGRNDD